MIKRFVIAVFLLVAPIFGATNATVQEQASACNVLAGKTGKALPAVIRDALKVLPQGVEVSQDQVVLIKDFDSWATCMGGKAETAQRLRQDSRMFVIQNQFPIYVVGEQEGVKKAAEYYMNGQGPHLKYTFAVLFSHEWQHAIGEQGELPAYTFEIEVMKAYIKAGKLPKECEQVDLRAAENRLAEERKKLATLVATR